MIREKLKNVALVQEEETTVSLQTIAAAKEISIDAVVAALSQTLFLQTPFLSFFFFLHISKVA